MVPLFLGNPYVILLERSHNKGKVRDPKDAQSLFGDNMGSVNYKTTKS